MGVTRDPILGPAVTVGLGGIFTEVLADVAVRPVPLDRRDAREMLASLRGAPLLRGVRGRPGVDLRALERLIVSGRGTRVGARRAPGRAGPESRDRHARRRRDRRPSRGPGVGRDRRTVDGRSAMETGLAGRTVIVTGGNANIGRGDRARVRGRAARTWSSSGATRRRARACATTCSSAAPRTRSGPARRRHRPRAGRPRW